MFRVQLQFFMILPQAPLLISRRQERSIEIVYVGRLRIGGQQLREVRLCRGGIPLGHRTDSSPGPLNQVLVAFRHVLGKDGPAPPSITTFTSTCIADSYCWIRVSSNIS